METAAEKEVGLVKDVFAPPRNLMLERRQQAKGVKGLANTANPLSSLDAGGEKGTYLSGWCRDLQLASSVPASASSAVADRVD